MVSEPVVTRVLYVYSRGCFHFTRYTRCFLLALFVCMCVSARPCASVTFLQLHGRLIVSHIFHSSLLSFPGTMARTRTPCHEWANVGWTPGVSPFWIACSARLTRPPPPLPPPPRPLRMAPPLALLRWVEAAGASLPSCLGAVAAAAPAPAATPSWGSRRLLPLPTPPRSACLSRLPWGAAPTAPASCLLGAEGTALPPWAISPPPPSRSNGRLHRAVRRRSQQLVSLLPLPLWPVGRPPARSLALR